MEIYLHKIIPVIFLPLGFTLILLSFGLLFKRSILILLALILLWLSSTPLISTFAIRSAEGWAHRIHANDAHQADAIVVLSGGRIVAPRLAGLGEWSGADRFYGGVELFHAGKAPALIFTVGWVPWESKVKPEEDILLKHAEELGVPLVNMLSTEAVINTAGEAQAVFELLTKQNININNSDRKTKILLVTSAFHMPRAQRLFEVVGLKVIPFPVDFKVSEARELTILEFIPSAGALAMTEMALREFYGRLFYWVIINFDLTSSPMKSSND
jgi:uncharacterized SAM-binding protein YcdF (DUF218 family)